MNSRISEEYRTLNQRLHEQRPDYGAFGGRWAPLVDDLISEQVSTVLDYGCGKASLAAMLPNLNIANYDPARPEFADEPHAADLVVCTDVLEHIEPENLDAVLDHIAFLAEKLVLFVIHVGPAQKSLPDGRNTHLIQQPFEWWLDKIARRWRVVRSLDRGAEIVFLGEAKRAAG